jgi:hypothetical protein
MPGRCQNLHSGSLRADEIFRQAAPAAKGGAEPIVLHQLNVVQSGAPGPGFSRCRRCGRQFAPSSTAARADKAGLLPASVLHRSFWRGNLDKTAAVVSTLQAAVYRWYSQTAALSRVKAITDYIRIR